MGVNPDDVTRKAVRLAGAREVHYGLYRWHWAFGVPGCGLHHRITFLDRVLPRILAGEEIGKKELAFLGHGGLCKDCPQCCYPHCPFGKGI